jgi:hypothetical protein
MLIRAGLEPHIAALAALVTCDDVGGDRLVSVTDMRLAIGIAMAVVM